MDISGAQTASSWEIPAGQTLRFDPAVSTTLTLTGNMIVRGVLEMRPARRSVTHRLVFAGVDESKFIGGGMNPVDSDVGLWVIEGGRLNLRGTRVGTTVSVHGTPLGPLYRNVRIQGTVQGRAHCFIHTTQPAKQYIDGVMFRFMGAAKAVMIGDTERRQIVLGRYGVHFHHCDDTSRGSVISNTVVRDSFNRGFVPHGSHGILVRRCLAYRVALDGYWWDPETEASMGENSSNDILIEDSIAATIEPSVGFSTLQGFTMPMGDRNVIRRCTAVDMRLGGSDGWGFVWPRSGSGKWVMEDCIAHHCDRGVFSWTGTQQIVRRFRSYECADTDVHAGAYRSSNIYEDCQLQSVPRSITEAGTSDPVGPHTFRRCTLAGILELSGSAVDGTVASVKPVQIIECVLEGGILVNQPDPVSEKPTSHEFIDCTRYGRGLVLADFQIIARHPRSVIDVRNADGSSFTV